MDARRDSNNAQIIREAIGASCASESRAMAILRVGPGNPRVVVAVGTSDGPKGLQSRVAPTKNFEENAHGVPKIRLP